MSEQHSPKRFPIHPGLMITALVACVAYGWIALPPASLGPDSDPTHYAVLAGYYSESMRGTVDPYTEFVYRASRFPPVWPALLGLLGGGPDTPGLLKAVTSGCAIAAVLLTWVWARRELHDPWLATVLATALALCPGFFFLNLEPHSEALGMVLMLGALLVATREPFDRANVYRGAALFALLALTRAICVVFAPAVTVWLLRARGGLYRAAIAGLLTALPLCLWLLFRASIPGNIGYSNYWNPDRDLAAVGGWLGFLLSQPHALIDSLVASLAPVGGPISRIAGFVICALALVGWVQRLVANRLDAWLLGSYVGVLFIWPFPSETGRFLVFLLPIVLVSAATAAGTLILRISPARGGLLAGSALLALALSSGPGVIQGLSRANLELDPELVSEKRAEKYFIAATPEDSRFVAEYSARARLTAEHLKTVIPEKQCVYAVQPTYVFVHARVPAVSFPDDFLAGRVGADTLGTCRYFYYVGGGFVGVGIPRIDVASALKGWTKPVLVSNQESPKGGVTVAAILEKSPPSN
ncbi:MAG: hypothetical protein ACKPE6_15535 [Gammaproteobacteria bacterium]